MPIGLIESSWGGTSVETWMPDEAIEDCGLNKLPDYVGVPIYEYCNLSRVKAYKMRRVSVGML